MSVAESLQIAQHILNAAFHQQSVKFAMNQHKIASCLSLLSDESSKLQYQSEITFLMLRDISLAAAKQVGPFTDSDWQKLKERWSVFSQSKECPDMICSPEEEEEMVYMLITTFLAEQYRYGDEVKVTPGEIFIDCGGCFGETALWAYQQGASEVYSFEPSPYSFATLQKNITNNSRDLRKCFNLAVGAANTKIPFVAIPGKGSSHVDAQGDIQVDCVVLDEWLVEHNIKPTFLKFDIEGSEYDALQGCRKTITELKPKLAVCLYHRFQDMFELPLLLHEMVPEYKFYCRKNSPVYEFILYATV